MKTIIIGLSILMGLSLSNNKNNPFDYDKAWKEVDELINQSLPKSAIEKVEEILKHAVADKNDPQLAKSVVFISRLSIQTDEQGVEKAIKKFQSFISENNRPVRYIVASYLAELYQRHFDTYRWEISQRSELVTEADEDFRIWSTQQFIKNISKWYLFSIANKNELQIPITEFTEILNNYDKEATRFRPNVYEVLVDRALEFYNVYDNYASENTDSFQLDQPWYFSDILEFSQKKITPPNNVNAKYSIISLYQEILTKQIHDKNKDAIADYDLKRLTYVYNQSTLENKSDLYQQALENLAKSHSDIDYFTEIMATLAGNILNNLSDSTRNIKAIEICSQAIQKYPNANGAAKCKNIIANIKKPSVQLYGEQVYPSKNPLLIAIDYNNISELILSTVKLNDEYFSLQQRSNQEQIREYLTKAKKISTVSQNLKGSHYFNTQRFEYHLSDLPYGQYALVVQNKEKSAESFQYLVFHVSDLAYTSYMYDQKRVLQVSNRLTGAPVKEVKVTLYQQNYNPAGRRYDFVKSGEYTTNINGRVTVNNMKERNIKIVLSHKKDKLDLNQFHYNYGSYENNAYSFAEFYTDRSIYRPGQIVNYKAILLQNDKRQIPSIISGKTVEIIFRDANYQEIFKTVQTSNDFGSINGSFVIPQGKLNGVFTISIQTPDGINGQKNIQVEEYKRPTFEVLTDPVKDEYKLNDEVKVTGKVLTLAGSEVDGATVSYKVVRNARFPGWGWWWRMPYPSSSFIIKQGQTQTKETGVFEVAFDALPDPKISVKDQPVFTYTLTIDVTDLRGETRSASTTVSVAYQNFTLQASLPKETDKDRLKPVKITATNTNGIAVETKGTLIVSKLTEPKTVKINSYWDGKTDFPLTGTIRKKYFPNYPVPSDQDFSMWAIDKIIYTSSFTTNDSIDLSNVLQAGVYKLEMAAQDKNNQTVSTTQYVVITDFKGNKFPKTDFLFTMLDKNEVLPGETIRLALNKSDHPIHVHAIIEKDGKILSEQYLKVDKRQDFTFNVDEFHRGGINIKLHYIISNRSYTKSHYIDVPWTSKHLDLSFETFRDKTLPGSKEEYRIKITGKNKDKVAAEMVAAMYDISLDQFTGHDWRTNFYPGSYTSINLETPGFHLVTGLFYWYNNTELAEVKELLYPSLIPLMDEYGGRGDMVMMKSMRQAATPEGALMMDAVQSPPSAPVAGDIKDTAINEKSEKAPKDQEALHVKIRKNLNETVFFFPELKTDKDGTIILSFTMNEALTTWRLMTFAHTKDFMTGYAERKIQTQKNIMVFPNVPRFVRDGDVVSFTAKVTNVTDMALAGKATLLLTDAITGKDITYELVKSPSVLSFSLDPKRSEGLSWDIFVPETKYQAITYQIIAEAGGHSDGEENTVPVVSNSLLVTETFPFWIQGGETKTIIFDQFKNNNSNTKSDFRYTFEYTANPVWYAIQALPYISSSNNAGTQALVDRFYANVMASKIANAHPKIKKVMEQWQLPGKEALWSNLSKNEELKSALLEETPWVRQAMSEAEQKRNIAVLFDMNKMGDERVNAIIKLGERQLSNGGFPWYPGGRDDTYTTQLVLENIGHVYQLKALELRDQNISAIVSKGVTYMDEELVRRYEKLKELIKQYGGNLDDYHLDELSVHYLYVRSFYSHIPIGPGTTQAHDYYFGQAKKYWLKHNLYSQAMIGLVLHRKKDQVVKNITKSLRERSFSNDELGMYWNEGNGFYWHQLPIERHALLLELFSEADPKQAETDRLKIWLLKNKQTNHWKTSKATAAAIYALLLQGEREDITPWINENKLPVITIGKEALKNELSLAEAGIGYIKKSYSAGNINKDMATVKVTNNNTSVAWGSLYYQYFEQLDRIKTFETTPLKLNKKLFKVNQTKEGEILSELSSANMLKPGDKIIVRIELRVDRPMEYVHMKDMRASGFEPLNVISEYKYQGQLGYYETTKDVATHFYFNYLPKGTFVFEYPLRVVHKGDFSAGITNIECMYAPEFSSHSDGIRVKVK